jgi:hypothetical protein
MQFADSPLILLDLAALPAGIAAQAPPLERRESLPVGCFVRLAVQGDDGPRYGWVGVQSARQGRYVGVGGGDEIGGALTGQTVAFRAEHVVSIG